jgi:exopolysaccharide biosynthesis protein
MTVMLAMPFQYDITFSRNRKTVKTLKNTNKRQSKKIKGKKNSRKNKRRVRLASATGPLTVTIVRDSVLSPGVNYRNYLMGRGKCQHSVHVIETDVTNPENLMLVLKAKNSAGELERLHEIVSNSKSTNGLDILAAVNANFWQAFSNRPIGPTVVNGEVVEMSAHKNWSSAFFDQNNRLYIGNISLSGKISDKKGNEFVIQAVNRRKDKSGMVLYNHFAGDTLPVAKGKNLMKLLESMPKDSLMDMTDSTEDVLDTAQMIQDLKEMERSSSNEYSLKKIGLSYIGSPAVNRKVACRIETVDTGTVVIPRNGVVVSLGEDFVNRYNLRLGDTLYIEFTTDEYRNKVFVNSVCGTPRLVSEGVAKHEAMLEGSRSRRFIGGSLARTAIGTDECGEVVYLVAVEPTNEGRTGANLAQLSEIMKSIGAFNAMNLDGGGSSIMVINNNNILRKARPDYSRRISVGLAAARRHGVVGRGK